MPEYESNYDISLDLATFFSSNPEANYEEREEGGLVVRPWDDPTLALRVAGDVGELVEALNAVYLPPRFTALWHKDSKDLEIIWGPVGTTDVLRSRSFDFRFNGKAVRCEFGDVSRRLMLIANAARFIEPPSVTGHRNLQAFELYRYMSEEHPDSTMATSTSLTSFWIRDIDWNENTVTELTRNLNFYMHYFDKETPLVEIHQNSPAKSEQDQSERYRHGSFPPEIVGRDLDPFLLGLWENEDEGDVVGVSEEVQAEIRRAAQGKDRYECDVCRYVAKGMPARCPVCSSDPTHFHAVDAEIATTGADDNLNLAEVYDGRELHWTDDAKALLDSLDEWQEKRRVRARVEKSALKKGYSTITLEYVEQQYREETGREAPKVEAPKASGCPVSHVKQQVEKTTGATCPIDHSAFQKAGALVPEGGSKDFTWTQEAIDRLDRAPKGFMRNISRNMTENLARERGVKEIDFALVEDSLSGARTTMEDVITGKVSIAELATSTGEKIEADDSGAPHPPMTVTMVCTVCNETMQGIQPPDECPVCGAPPEDFEAKDL